MEEQFCAECLACSTSPAEQTRKQHHTIAARLAITLERFDSHLRLVKLHVSAAPPLVTYAEERHSPAMLSSNLSSPPKLP